VSQLCVNTLPTTNITLITDGIKFGSLRVKLQTPANHPEESIRPSEQGESLKSRITILYMLLALVEIHVF
jgi:hypothetical protein